MAWIRTCQECGHKQSMKPPTDQKTDNWRNAKCCRCQSVALDYGAEQQSEPAGEWMDEWGKE